MSPSWYVYALIDPRDKGIFYIGKGKNRRAFQHELDVKRGKVRNQQKTDRIKEILDAGLAVEVQVLATFDDEEEAYAYEAQVIETMDSLLNMMPGGGGSRSIPLAVSSAASGLKKAEAALAKIMPFEKWVEKRHPPEWMLPLHAEIKENLEALAARCREVVDEWRAA